MTESDSEKAGSKEKIILPDEIISRIKSATRYCFNCNKCVNICPVSFYDKFYPRNLITDLDFSGPEIALKNNNIWACLTCGLCMEYCPMSKENVGVDFLDVILSLRSISNECQPLQDKKMECQHNRTYSNLPYLMANDKIKFRNKLGFLDETNLKFKEQGEIAYFLGCLPFMNSIPPCSNSCPAGIDIQGYISLIREGKYQESLDLIREKNPFPAVCGRICTHPCEDSCNRKEIDESIHIRALKRFVADFEFENQGKTQIKPVEQTKEKVAIVGSGPSGLTAAYFLARMGYKPTIFEKEDYTGGKLRDSIPEFRLPRNVLDYEIEFIKSMGVEIKINTPIGPDLTFNDLFARGYKAIMISIGLLNNRAMGIASENLNNVMYGVEFLQQKNLNIKEHDFKDKTVGVVGGGSTAIDSARTALRLGAKKVMIIYRRSETEMPALEEDIEGSKEENIEFLFLTNPECVIQDEIGDCIEAECVKMELGEHDSSGRRRPIVVQNSNFKLKLDVLIFAIGQVPDLSLLRSAHDKLIVGKSKSIQFNSETLETNIPGVFIGGDILEGEGTAIQAIADGHKAAISIDRYLRGKDLLKERIETEKLKTSPIPKKKVLSRLREKMNLRSVEERVRNFDEVELGYDEEKAKKEAERCLLCNLCCSTDQKLEKFNESEGMQHCSYGKYPPLTQYNDFDYTKIAKSVISILNQNGIVPVLLNQEKCCGHDNLWQGDFETYEKLAKFNVKLFKDAGVKTLIFSCAEGYYTWKYEYKRLFKDKDFFDFKIYHITEYLLKIGFLDDIMHLKKDKIRVTYQDACRLGRLSKVYDAPRELLNKLPFIELIEMQSNREDSLCCGVSSYVCCEDYSKLIQGRCIDEAINTGAEYMLVSCPKCLTHFNCYLNENEHLKAKIKVVDIVTFIAKMLFFI